MLLPRYPTPDEINALDILSQACTQQLPPHDKYIAGYLGPPPHHEQTITRNKLIVMPVPPCANHPDYIDHETLTRINTFMDKFHQPFNRKAQGRKQYAVLYTMARTLPIQTHLIHCLRVAEGLLKVMVGLQPFQSPKEMSNQQMIDCNNIHSRDIYLYTYSSPCRNCAEIIVNFARQCSGYYRSFKVFYRAEYRDCLQSSTYIKGYSSDRQLKMDFFQAHVGPRP